MTGDALRALEARLRDLLAKATPLPWAAPGKKPALVWSPCGTMVVANAATGPRDAEHRRQAPTNAALIAEGISALPALLDALATAREGAEALGVKLAAESRAWGIERDKLNAEWAARVAALKSKLERADAEADRIIETAVRSPGNKTAAEQADAAVAIRRASRAAHPALGHPAPTPAERKPPEGHQP